MAPVSTTKKPAMAVLITMFVVLPLSTRASRSGPTDVPHHGHAGHGSSPKHASPPNNPPPTVAALVRATCNSTSYYDLCVSALGADPSSATADVNGLSTIAVSAAATNASGGAATAAALANGTATSSSSSAQAAAPATATALLRTCAAKYGQAQDALAAARDSIAQQDYDFASVHVSAAAEYPQVCRALFRRQKPGQYPPELAAREEALRQLCSVALDIIALASNVSS